MTPRSGHSTLQTSVTGNQKFCADSHCRGDCGFPGLFLRKYIDMTNGLEREDALASHAPQDDGGRFYHDYKAHGSMVAHGPVWQRKTWNGERIYLPEEFQTETTHDMWWR